MEIHYHHTIRKGVQVTGINCRQVCDVHTFCIAYVKPLLRNILHCDITSNVLTHTLVMLYASHVPSV
jgi:hypothetical protein